MVMDFSSLLTDTLQRFPFDENQDFNIHALQCQALCAYFSSTLDRFFGASFRPAVHPARAPSHRRMAPSHPQRPAESAPPSARRWNSLSNLYDKTLSKWWSLRKEHRSSSESFCPDYSISTILLELKKTPHAIEELYRVIKEAQFFLHACRSPEWWRSAFFLGMGLQAMLVCDVHVHDLMWCIAGLKLCLQSARGVELESRARFTCISIIEGYAEMEVMSYGVSEFARAFKRDLECLCSDLQQVKAKYDATSLLRKKIMNSQEKLKHETFQFLLQKLDFKSQSTSPSLALKPPQSMFIHTQDLDIPSQPCVIMKGTDTQVIEALWLGIKVAIKQFDFNSCKGEFEYEAAARVKLQSPFFIQLFGWSHNAQESAYYLVLEHHLTSLQSIVAGRQETKKQTSLNRMHSPLRLPVLVDLMLQVARGMDYMHSEKIAYGGLQPSSILVEPLSSSMDLREEGYGRVKLCDFNFGTKKSCTAYRAPELWSLQAGGELDRECQADVYAYAMTFAYALTGQEPFAAITTPTVLQDLLVRGARPDLPASCPMFLNELIQSCWLENPSSRPSFASIAMALRQLKLLLMKTSPGRWSERQMDKEAFLSTPVITYQQLCMATQNFTRKFSSISAESVYRGVLLDGSDVIVQKKCGRVGGVVLWAEALQMMGLRHSNVAYLRAICIHDSECWFIFKCNGVQGSLDRWLIGEHKPMLDSMTCFQVVLGVACGLQYIHSQDMVHGLSAKNVLLNQQFEPQILVDVPALQDNDDGSDDVECRQAIDVVRFGDLVTQVLGYLSSDGAATASGCAESCHVSMLKDVEGFCLNSGSAKMDEVVEMLEYHYEHDLQVSDELNELLQVGDCCREADSFFTSDPI